MAAPSHSSRPGTAAYAGVEVTPSDTVDLVTPCYGIYIGVTGNLRVTHWNGGTCNYANLPVGWHPIAATRIHATGTTATSIVAVS